MSLHLLTGSTGTGKTYHLYKSIIDSAIQHPGKRHVVLVPEQFTMQTQRALVEMHPGHAILNTEVMSFDWLAHQILKDLSKPGVHILDDSGHQHAAAQIRRREEERTGLLPQESDEGRLHQPHEIHAGRAASVWHHRGGSGPSEK